MGTGEFVELVGLVGAVTRYYNSAALNQEAGAVALIMFSLCAAGAVIGMLWRWHQEHKGKR